jgi:hypothetical protein
MAQPLAQGELLYVTDDQRLFIGNGSTLGGIQITGYNDENAVDAIGTALTNGVHTGISFTYGSVQDLAGRIDVAVDLSNYAGVIRADAFKGSVFADDGSTIGGTLLVDAVAGSINLNGTVKGNIIPDTNIAYDLGSATYRFRDLYLSGSSIKLGDATITATGSVVNLPAGSTIGGIDIVNGVINADIIGDDSTVIVNSGQQSINAQGGITSSIINSNALNLNKNTDGFSLLMVGISNDVTSSTGIEFASSRNTTESPTDLIDDDVNFALIGKTWKNSISNYAFSTGILSIVDNINPDPVSNVIGGKLSFYATDGTRGLFDDDYAMSLSGNGTVSARQLSVARYLKFPVFANATARDAELTVPETGMVAILDDTGSGPGIQYYDGLAWVTL